MSLAPPGPVARLSPGQILDRYELLCPIAEGGMGVCWLARVRGKHGFEKLVAIKTMKAEYAADPTFHKMLLDEARLASRIEHANVAQILDIGEHEGILYLAMEYVDGDALSKLQRETTSKSVAIPPGVALRILADTCGGLHAAHELTDDDGKLLGVVHRDVSPQNILVNIKGAAKLIDFGIAKARDRTSGDTSTGTIKGKIHYMAPEQALGRGDLDRRADVFSVGAILYLLLSGKRAFAAESEVATILLLASGRPPIPLPKTVAAPIAAVVLRALAADKKRRFASALELQEAIEDAMVKADVTTSANAVAAFLAEHLGHRAATRKKATECALQLVATGGFAEMAASTAFPSDRGLLTGTPVSRPGVPQSTKIGIGPIDGPDAGQPAAIPTVTPPSDSVRHEALMAVLALNTDGNSPTLTASAVWQPTPAPAPRRRTASLLVFVGGPALALVGVILTLLALRRPDPASTNVAVDRGGDPSAASAMTTASASATPAESSAPSSASSAGGDSPSPAQASARIAASTAPTTTAPRVPKTAATATATATATTSARKKKVVDDGF